MDEITGPNPSPALHAPEASVIDNARIRTPGRPSIEAARYGAIALLGSLWACAASPTTVRAPYQTKQFVGPAFTCAVPKRDVATGPREDPAALFEQYVAPIFVAVKGSGARAKLDLRGDHVCKLKTALALRHVPAERRIDVLYAVLAATPESLATTECEALFNYEFKAAPSAWPQFDYDKCARLDDARVLAAETIAASGLLEHERIWPWVIRASLRPWAAWGPDRWLRADHLDAHVMSTLHPYFHSILSQRLIAASVEKPNAAWLEAAGVIRFWTCMATSVKSRPMGDIYAAQLVAARVTTIRQLSQAAGLEDEAISLSHICAEFPVGGASEAVNAEASLLRGPQPAYERCNEPGAYDVSLYMVQHLILRLSVLDIELAGQLVNEVCADADSFEAFLALANITDEGHRRFQPAVDMLAAHDAVIAATTFASHENTGLAISAVRLIASAARDVSRTHTSAQRAWVAERLVVMAEKNSGPRNVSESATRQEIYFEALCQALSALGRTARTCQ